MQFESFGQFLEMGGYGLYVWLAYGAFVLVFVGLIISSRRFRQLTYSEIEQAQVRAERLKEVTKRRNHESTS